MVYVSYKKLIRFFSFCSVPKPPTLLLESSTISTFIMAAQRPTRTIKSIDRFDPNDPKWVPGSNNASSAPDREIDHYQLCFGEDPGKEEIIDQLLQDKLQEVMTQDDKEFIVDDNEKIATDELPDDEEEWDSEEEDTEEEEYTSEWEEED